MAAHTQIMVVEDDPEIREAIAELLGHEGYDVTTAAHGREALALLDHGARPSLILLDLMMPVMDGWAFRSAQREHPRHGSIPVLVLSASHGRDLSVVESMGVQGFLAKPFEFSALIGEVGSIVAGAAHATT